MSQQGPQGFPDYQRFTQAVPGPLLTALNVPIVGPVQLGPFYVGGFQSLYLRQFKMGAAPSQGNLSVQFSNTQTPFNVIATVSTAATDVGAVNNVIPVLGNWVRFTINASTYVAQTYNLNVFPYSATWRVGASTDTNGTSTLFHSGAIAAGATAVVKPGNTAHGPAMLTVTSDQPGVAVAVDFTDFIGGLWPVLRKTVNAPLMGDSFDLMIPRAAIIVTLINTSAAVANMTAVIVMDTTSQ
jgi:hypothetical protein